MKRPKCYFRVNAQSRVAFREAPMRLRDLDFDERSLQAMLFDQLDRLLPDDELLLVMQSSDGRKNRT
jgi:hypothetical protein